MTAFKDFVKKDTAGYNKVVTYNEYVMYLNAKYALDHGVFLLNVKKNNNLYVSFFTEYKLSEKLKTLNQFKDRKMSDSAFKVLKKEYEIFAKDCERMFLKRSGF